MPTYQNPIDDDERLTLAETDKPLAETLNPAFRYALFSQIAKGSKSTIQSCMDLYLGRKVCHKSLRRNLPATTSSNADSYVGQNHRSSPAPKYCPNL